MTVSITWALTSMGSPVTLVNHGNAANGEYTSPNQNVYIRHDGSNPITNCAFYFQQKASGYTGSFSAAADFTEIKAWGDSSTSSGHGGVQVNMDPTNSTGYNATTWNLSNTTKTTTVAFTMHTSVADTTNNAVTLKEHMSAGMSVDGQIPNGVEARFLARFLVPTDEDTAGVRQIDQVLKYTFTS